MHSGSSVTGFVFIIINFSGFFTAAAANFKSSVASFKKIINGLDQNKYVCENCGFYSQAVPSKIVKVCIYLNTYNLSIRNYVFINILYKADNKFVLRSNM